MQSLQSHKGALSILLKQLDGKVFGMDLYTSPFKHLCALNAKLALSNTKNKNWIEADGLDFFKIAIGYSLNHDLH
jgi:hypothetical protein